MAIKQIHQSIIHTHTMNPVPRTRPNLSRLPRCCLLSCLCVLLAQCASTDTGFERLEATAATNPPRDAIVGMWHRKDTLYPSVATRWSWLFRGNGTGVFRATLRGVSPTVDNESQSAFTWHYEGNGLWTMRSPNDSNRSEGRISGNNLLLSYFGPMGTQNFICERVD